MRKIVRASLLGAVSLVAFTSEAQAGCVADASFTTTTCGNTTTSDTTAPANAPDDREILVDPTGAPVAVVVGAGVTINGNGLAVTEAAPVIITLAAVNPITVTNNGSIVVDAGNAPANGGTAALNITSDDASIIYNGNGSVTNNGTGNGVGIVVNGAGSVTYDNRGAVLSTDGDGIVILGGDGNIAVTAGQVSANAAGARGIAVGAASAAGNIGVTATGNISTIAGTGISVTQASLSATGTVSDTIMPGVVINAANLGVDLQNLGNGATSLINDGSVTTTNGIAGRVDARGGGNVSVSGAGTYNGGTGVGLLVSARIAGNVTINQTGAISGGQGIVSSAEIGNQNITVGDVTGTSNAAIDARSVSGLIAIQVNGNARGGNFGIFTQSGATKTVTVAAGHSVTTNGGADIAIGFGGDGANAIINNGTIGQAGKDAVLVTGAGAVTITNASTGIINGSLQLGDADDTITNAGTFNFDGFSDFGGGTDVFTNQASGTVNFGNATGIAGLETFNNAGRVNVPVIITLFGTTFNNLAGGQLVATGGNSRIGGALLLNNAGRIVLSDNTANDILTFDGNYVGSGAGSLSIDVTRDLTAADRLVVLGSVSGATLVNVNLLPGSGMINTAGALIVDAGTSTANAFVLAPIAATGFVDYAIEQRGADYFLIALANPMLGEVAGLGLVAPDLWYQSFDSAREAIAGRSAASWGEGRRLGFWGQLYASRESYGSRNVSANVFGTDVTYGGRIHDDGHGAQGGIDYPIGPFVVGVTGGYEHIDADAGHSSDIKAKGYNYGAYALIGGDSGPYGNLTVKRDNYHLRFLNRVRDLSVRPDGHSTGIDAEIGYRGQQGSAALDLRAGLSAVRTRVDDFAIDSIDFSIDRVNSLRGRAGARAVFSQYYGAFLDTTLFHEFKGNSSVDAVNGAATDSFGIHGRGTWGRIEAGLGASLKTGLIVSAFVEVGDVHGIGGRGTFRF